MEATGHSQISIIVNTKVIPSALVLAQVATAQQDFVPKPSPLSAYAPTPARALHWGGPNPAGPVSRPDPDDPWGEDLANHDSGDGGGGGGGGGSCVIS